MTATFFIFLSCTHEEATTRAFFQNSASVGCTSGSLSMARRI
jgi:hypothetical protein